MTPPGSNVAVAEVVTVVEHPAFASLYREQLSQEGLQIEEIEVDDVPTEDEFLELFQHRVIVRTTALNRTIASNAADAGLRLAT